MGALLRRRFGAAAGRRDTEKRESTEEEEPQGHRSTEARSRFDRSARVSLPLTTNLGD